MVPVLLVKLGPCALGLVGWVVLRWGAESVGFGGVDLSSGSGRIGIRDTLGPDGAVVACSCWRQARVLSMALAASMEAARS